MTLQHILQPDQKTPHDHSVFTLININTKVIFIHDFTESTPLILSEQ